MIVKRGGRYGVSVYDPSLRRKRWVGTFATRREALEAERAASQKRGVLRSIQLGGFRGALAT